MTEKQQAAHQALKAAADDNGHVFVLGASNKFTGKANSNTVNRTFRALLGQLEKLGLYQPDTTKVKGAFGWVK